MSRHIHRYHLQVLHPEPFFQDQARQQDRSLGTVIHVKPLDILQRPVGKQPHAFDGPVTADGGHRNNLQGGNEEIGRDGGDGNIHPSLQSSFPI